MPLFQIIAVGTFCPAGKSTNSEFALSSGEMIAGFYTARAVQAKSKNEAIDIAADVIQDDLSEIFDVKKSDYIIEIESVVELSEEPDYVSRGFTFFGND